MIVEFFSEIPDLMQDLVDYNLPLTMDIKPEKIKMKKLKRLEKGDKPKKKKKLKVTLDLMPFYNTGLMTKRLWIRIPLVVQCVFSPLYTNGLFLLV